MSPRETDADTAAVVRQDLLVAPMLVASGALVGVAELAVELWWVGVAVAAGTAAVSALSDRSRHGTWLAFGVGTVAILAVLWSTWDSGVPVGAIAWSNAGLGVGMGLNRLVYGVLRPVPDARLARQCDGGV